jgi:hypothetical protein
MDSVSQDVKPLLERERDVRVPDSKLSSGVPISEICVTMYPVLKGKISI